MEEGKDYCDVKWVHSDFHGKVLTVIITSHYLENGGYTKEGRLGPRPYGIRAMIAKDKLRLFGKRNGVPPDPEECIIIKGLIPLDAEYWYSWAIPLVREIHTLYEKHLNPTSHKSGSGKCECSLDVMMNLGCQCGAITPYRSKSPW